MVERFKVKELNEKLCFKRKRDNNRVMDDDMNRFSRLKSTFNA